MASKIILVTGAPATGKTTIAKELGQRYSLPVIHKDDIKESLFDSISWSDREWSRKLGVATYVIMYYMLEAQLKAQKSFVMESDFRPNFDVPKLLALKEKYNFESLVIHCSTEPTVLLERFKTRLTSGNRHPGHNDHDNLGMFEPEALKKDFGPLDIGGVQFEIDTTNFESINYDALWKQVDQFLNI